MNYKILFHPDAAREVEKLDNQVRLLVFKQIKKLSLTPGLGRELGNKQGLDLSGYRKIYADKKRIRIVYKFSDKTIMVQIIAVGKRESMKVYKDAAKRIQGVNQK
ncbi:MAG: type II toxin-antitoxin system RelE/ParE family toxin [Desulfobacula sp.]|nr:type II toxin-antitoxin system RelE/ParE family toxin [Desulfobacula sp.]